MTSIIEIKFFPKKKFIEFKNFFLSLILEYVKKLCQFLKLNKTDAELNNILIELDKLHKSSQIVKSDNFKNPQYQKTLLSQSHNTDNGKSNKYETHFSLVENKKILQNTKIYNFLSKYGYLGT